MLYKSSQERAKRLKKLELETKNNSYAGAYYNKRKNRLEKYSCHSKWLKSRSRKETRRRTKLAGENIATKGNEHKKRFDYWWELL